LRLAIPKTGVQATPFLKDIGSGLVGSVETGVLASMDETRRTPRYPFGAPAEVIVEASGANLLCRVKELSLYGCYLDSSVPLGVKAQVLLKIYGPHDYFEATATVIYTHPMLGMGIAFREVRPSFLPILQKWLVQSMQNQNPAKS
jgi:hypothetical protein